MSRTIYAVAGLAAGLLLSVSFLTRDSGGLIASPSRAGVHHDERPHDVVVPAEALPEDLREAYADEAGHVHLQGPVSDMNVRIQLMEEYKDFSLEDISAEIEALQPLYNQGLDDFFNAKQAKGDYRALPPSGRFKTLDDGTTVPLVSLRGEQLGSGPARSIGQSDGSSILMTMSPHEDPVLQNLVDRMTFLRIRQEYLMALETQAGLNR